MAHDPESAERPPPRLRPGARIGAVVSTFHAELTEAMLESAWRELAAAGLPEGELLVLRVPGAFELPLVARRLAIREDVDAVMCLGAVIRGETDHNRHVAEAAARGVLQVSLETDKPILFGVLTCDSIAQARARALPRERGGAEDKGREVARSALAVLSALEDARRIGASPRSVGFGAWTPAASPGAGEPAGRSEA